MKIISWNLNGIRACTKNGFADWLKRCRADVVMLQEVRAMQEQVPEEVSAVSKYNQFWFPASSRKGYSGTGILCLENPKRVIEGIGIEDFDREGRVLGAEFEKFFVFSAYFPNSQDGGKRIEYKIDFCDALQKYLVKLRKESGKPIILGGDFNIAHKPLDLARPENNENSPGYLPEERDWMEKFINSGWVDTFRYKHPDTVKYSWWSFRTRARDRNIGWRIDYHTMLKQDADLIEKADILTDVMGSDHCPVSLVVDL